MSLFILALAIQFVPVNRTNPPIEAELQAPPEVHAILKRACYDCHSNETAWPWYSAIAPVSWLVADDVRKGRAELNFSKWGTYNEKRKIKKLTEIWEEVSENEMPPWIYLVVHKKGLVTAEEQKAIHAWVEGMVPGE